MYNAYVHHDTMRRKGRCGCEPPPDFSIEKAAPAAASDGRDWERGFG
jgi:hypothetical protein